MTQDEENRLRLRILSVMGVLFAGALLMGVAVA